MALWNQTRSLLQGTCWEMSARNEQLGNKSGGTQGECKWITAAHSLLCWCTAASALGRQHSLRIETRRHDKRSFLTCALQQTSFLAAKLPFPLESQVISGFPRKKQGFPRNVLVPEKDAALVVGEMPRKLAGNAFIDRDRGSDRGKAKTGRQTD